MVISERAHVSALPLRERNKARNRAALERAGRTLFVRKGFDETTTRAIAAKAGVGAGTFFLYFKEKRDLLFHIFDKDIGEVKAKAVARMGGGELVSDLCALFGCFFEYYERTPELSRIFLKELMFLPAVRQREMERLTSSLLHTIADRIALAREAGEIDTDVPTMDAALHVFGLYWFTVVIWLSGTLPDRAAAERRLEGSLELAVRGLSQRRTR